MKYILFVCLIALIGCGEKNLGRDYSDTPSSSTGDTSSSSTSNTSSSSIDTSLTHDCSHEIGSLVNERGEAEEINAYDSDNYHSHSYWYWSQGYEKSFKWGEYSDGCETSEYTFEPIGE